MGWEVLGMTIREDLQIEDCWIQRCRNPWPKASIIVNLLPFPSFTTTLFPHQDPQLTLNQQSS